jgi:hypothetical protein
VVFEEVVVDVLSNIHLKKTLKLCSCITITHHHTFIFSYFYKAFKEIKEQNYSWVTDKCNESLKNQMIRIFLFNSLQRFKFFDRRKSRSCNKFTTSFIQSIRCLNKKDKELVTTKRVEFRKKLYNLLKMRFENSIAFEQPICKI